MILLLILASHIQIGEIKEVSLVIGFGIGLLERDLFGFMESLWLLYGSFCCSIYFLGIPLIILVSECIFNPVIPL